MNRSTTPAGRRGRLLAAQRIAALVGVLGLTSSVLLVGLGSAPASASDEASAPDFEKTRVITREHVNADGSVDKVDERSVTVRVDDTQELRGRERVTVSWSGARPSAGRTNPYGMDGLNQEYPVVIMLCRGLDDPDLPVASRLRPETCWTSTYTQRLGQEVTPNAVWRHDRYATEADRADPDPAAWPSACGRMQTGVLSYHLLPFAAANGTSYPFCDSATVAPEAAVNSALPAAEVAAFTRLDGTGEVEFEVRSAAENESLGCSSEVRCSIVVIPIMGISCEGSDAVCRADGRLEPGSTNSLNSAVDGAVSTYFWWSESNWRNRFSVPLTFALAPDVCDVLDDRAPVDFYGSELMAQASLQWAPAYCLRDDRFKFRHNRMSENAALRLVDTGEAVAAFTSRKAASTGKAFGYAPVAVTGFAVAYISDLPENAGELTTLRLTPRLIAKLLTQSYAASTGGRLHPGLENNPVTINKDPEFLALNPGVSQIDQETLATLLSQSEASDVIWAVTDYVASDPEAMAFVNGEPDPSGMVVNPFYKGISLPRDEWPLLDTWVRQSQQACDQTLRIPYLTRVAAPVVSFRRIAEAVLDAWPNVQTVCTRAQTTDPWKQGRVERQPYGARFMLGLVTLGDAERFGLRTAELRTAGTGADATFVAPTSDSMTAALGSLTSAAPGDPFVLDQEALPDAAYPGTMVVHVAAPLSGLSATDAGHVTQFIQVATTEGQETGRGNGKLPAGFVPIASGGATAQLYTSAQAVATAVTAQKGSMPQAPTGGGGSGGSAGGGAGGGAGGTPTAATPPRSAAPAAGPATAPVAGLPADEAAADEAAVVAYGRTETQTSKVGSRAVPLAFGVGIAGLLGAPVLQLLTRRRRLS